MSEARIPVALNNPGQVFACLGFMEAADILMGNAEGGFEWNDGENTWFVLRATGDADPILTVIDFLRHAAPEAIAPDIDLKTEAQEKKGEKVSVTLGEDGLSPSPRPSSASALPCQLKAKNYTVPITYWVAENGLDNVKFWAGMGGKTGASLIDDLLEQIKGWSHNQIPAVVLDPFGNHEPLASTLQSSNLRFDYRSGTIPFDAGFSTNAHNNYDMVGFPLVDVLAAIGLEHARPVRPERSNKLAYTYSIWPVALPVLLARAALGGANFGFNSQTYRIELGWPGQENQARAIKTVKKETHS